MLDEFFPETSGAREAKRPPPSPALGHFRSEAELAGSVPLPLLQALRSAAPRGRPATRARARTDVKKLMAGAVLGIAAGIAAGFIVADRDPSPVEAPPAAVSEDGTPSASSSAQAATEAVVTVPALPSSVVALAEPPPAMSLSAVVEFRRSEPALPPPIRPANDQAAIDDILSRYRAAYETRDAEAVKRVWPRANEPALAKAFADLESQNLAFYGCRTSIEDSTARASCDGQVSYVARLGSKNRRTQHRNWTFTLRRTSRDDWQIDEVQIR